MFINQREKEEARRLSFHWLPGRGAAIFLPGAKINLVSAKTALRRSKKAFRERKRYRKKKESLRADKLDEELTELINDARLRKSRETFVNFQQLSSGDNIVMPRYF